MRKFLIRGSIFIVTLFLIATFLQAIIDNGLKKNPDNKEWADIFSSNINADILIQGSSRAMRHISTYTLDSAFKMNSYNLGLRAYPFLMQYYRFLLYIEYNKAPKYIIQNIDAGTLGKRTDLFDYQQFLPYLNSSILRRAISSFHGLNWIDFYIPLYKYRSTYNLAYRGLINNIVKPTDNVEDHKGFEPFIALRDSAFGRFELDHPNGFRYPIDKETVDLFVVFLNLCKEKGITVIFVYTPEYYRAQEMQLNLDSVTTIFKNYAELYHIPFLNYSKDSICLDPLNFYNYEHLNINGARKFNAKLVRDLKGLIK